MPLGPQDEGLLEALAVLVRESLVLWGLDGTVTRESDGLAIAAGDRLLSVERGIGDLFGWRLTDGDSPPRPCTSVLDVLRALRSRLVEGVPASRVRPGSVAAAP